MFSYFPLLSSRALYFLYGFSISIAVTHHHSGNPSQGNTSLWEGPDLWSPDSCLTQSNAITSGPCWIQTHLPSHARFTPAKHLEGRFSCFFTFVWLLMTVMVEKPTLSLLLTKRLAFESYTVILTCCTITLFYICTTGWTLTAFLRLCTLTILHSGHVVANWLRRWSYLKVVRSPNLLLLGPWVRPPTLNR